MTINMKSKVDIYLANPAYFQTDLLNQARIWKDHVVNPLGSHYEDSKKQVDIVIGIAKKNKEEMAQRLAKIDLINSIVIGVLLTGVDIMAAGALKNVALMSKKFNSQKDLDSFLAGGKSIDAAFKEFSSQKSTFVDNIAANIDDKIKGLAATSSITGAYDVIKKMVADIEASVPEGMNDAFDGPLKFQNKLESHYSKSATAINEAFVALVRDSSAPAVFKRAVVEHFVNLPFVKPPTISLEAFSGIFKNYFELCYWCQMISSAAAGEKNFGLIDNDLADVVNQRFLNLSGYVITHVGGTKLLDSSIVRKEQSGVILGDVKRGDIRMSWDGFCSKSQVMASSKALADAKKESVDSIFLALGMDIAQSYI